MRQPIFFLLAWLAMTPALLGSVVARADVAAGIAAYRSGEFEAAALEFKRLAEQGEVRAQAILGLLYEYGEGVPQSYEEAARWYRTAAEQGSAAAQFSLAELYVSGEGVVRNLSSAEHWYALAAERGHKRAERQLMALYARGEPLPTPAMPVPLYPRRLRLALDEFIEPVNAATPLPPLESRGQLRLELDYRLERTPG